MATHSTTLATFSSRRTLPAAPAAVRWRAETQPVPYERATAFMDSHSHAMRNQGAPEMVWLLEHPPLYSAGLNSRPRDLLDGHSLPVHRSRRGGGYTYHGPGQRIAYPLLNVAARYPCGTGIDVKALTGDMEEWLIRTLAQWSLRGQRQPGFPGVWVRRPQRSGHTGGLAKIAAIGLAVRRGISTHGVSLNLSCNLAHYRGIRPCGLEAGAITSCRRLGVEVSTPEADRALRSCFAQIFA